MEVKEPVSGSNREPSGTETPHSEDSVIKTRRGQVELIREARAHTTARAVKQSEEGTATKLRTAGRRGAQDGRGGVLGELVVGLLWGSTRYRLYNLLVLCTFLSVNKSQCYNRTTTKHSPEGSRETG